jgi:putative restriction endonuclease
MLVSRKVRNRQFRKRVLEAYGCECAFTGMRLINGGGRAEAQAAHIMSVEAGGPDRVTNGLALSGTVHWMFDRRLLSLSDRGEILLSRKINDIDGVKKLSHADRQARLPSSSALRPHSRYLQWHRERFEDETGGQVR